MRFAIALISFLVVLSSSAIEISSRYRSPRNPERRVRPATKLIILHTTEAPARSSINKVSDRGECNYIVTEEGSTYSIIDRDKEAFHAGRSMWNGQEDIDKVSVGIECVGYHDKAMASVQLRAIRDLVKELQRMYRLSDDKVICHSHVAYGNPNRWQRFKHRGRKRCGMLFAMPSVRRQLGLKSRPAYDPDVRAHRLVVGDSYLNRALYSNLDTMKNIYGHGEVMGSNSNNNSGFLGWLGLGGGSTLVAEAKETKPAPKWTRQVVTRSVPKPKAEIKRAFVRLPETEDDLKAQGYIYRGEVSKVATASKLAGDKWNSDKVYYAIRDKVIPGNIIRADKIERGMRVWVKK